MFSRSSLLVAFAALAAVASATKSQCNTGSIQWSRSLQPETDVARRSEGPRMRRQSYRGRIKFSRWYAASRAQTASHNRNSHPVAKADVDNAHAAVVGDAQLQAHASERSGQGLYNDRRLRELACPTLLASMIITESAADAKNQPTRVGDPEAQRTSESRLLAEGPPPAYGAGPSSNILYKPYPPGALEEHAERTATRAARRRFLGAFAVAVLIWVLVGMLTGSIADLGRWGRNHNNRAVAQDVETGMGWPSAEDGHIERCVHGDQWSEAHPYPDDHERYIRTTSFKLPVDAEHLFFISTGALSYGKLDIVQGEHEGNDIEVEVSVVYWLERILKKASVCRLSREDDQHGVGIFTPRYWKHQTNKESLDFRLVAKLPRPRRSPGHIKKFTTSLHNFATHVGSFLGVYHFDSITLRSTNRPAVIEARQRLVCLFPIMLTMTQSLGGERINIITTNSAVEVSDIVQSPATEIHTTNGPITGVYNSSTSLSLTTSNARIKADVHLYNYGKTESTLSVATTNSPLEANISFYNATSKPSHFKAFTTTSNAALNVHFPTLAIDSVLNYIAHTTNSPASVYLHPAFEGSFHGRTSVMPARLEIPDFKNDPAGRGRTRQVQNLQQRSREFSGQTWWGPSHPKELGSVSVSTTNSPVYLRL
ncbi:hypothetical protein PUNSTDRAFT_126011 [Punctularia strigosozonata HHB-11173 SS5]|uniref:uncharacterized protein n=1 Tax=Punctularia strigosozonata (strain HHB-11173) TaxID=741275 RepID=UPI0004416A51|nr:uncharacterized protein PUNSTDRAFT_126011 [Punctularia strigosozonata HHB-11173 SS5]EIN10113.1 hypothetical protein PUNSTDRAFT_126011 [Punctularia strigosozonata HHB-11173 SS5]